MPRAARKTASPADDAAAAVEAAQDGPEAAPGDVSPDIQVGRRIRADLVGVVHLGSHILQAGDVIPDGFDVGPHLLDEPGE